MKKIKESKLVIIGSGPAGCTAAIYAARSNLSPLLIHGLQPGGHMTITNDVENFPGFIDKVAGPWLMTQMEEQAKKYGTEVINDVIVKVDFSKNPFKLMGESGVEYRAKALIVSTGASAKWLGIESEKKFQGFGVSGCATCDGFFFKNKIVAVIGGGNSAVEEALYLTHHASKVYLIHRRDKLRAEKIQQQRLFAHPKIETIWNSEVKEILGDDNPPSVTGIEIINNVTNKKSKIKLDGVFVAIGHKPNTDVFKDFLAIDDDGYIITEAKSTKTNIDGVFACGDVQDKIYRQAVTSAGSGCMAAIDALKFIEGKELEGK